MNIENRMVLGQPQTKQETVDVKEAFSDYCEKEASLKEFLELFYETWSPLEIHTFSVNGNYEAEIARFHVDYAKYLIEQSGIDIELSIAVSILGEIA